MTDGVTIKVLDAPEKKMPFGHRSKHHHSDLVYSKWVAVEGEKNGRYGRMVWKVLVNGRDANLTDLKGCARERHHRRPVGLSNGEIAIFIFGFMLKPKTRLQRRPLSKGVQNTLLGTCTLDDTDLGESNG